MSESIDLLTKKLSEIHSWTSSDIWKKLLKKLLNALKSDKNR